MGGIGVGGEGGGGVVSGGTGGVGYGDDSLLLKSSLTVSPCHLFLKSL